MLDYAWLLTVLQNGQKWFRLVSQRAKDDKLENEKDRQTMVAALYTALTETQIYIGAMRKKEAAQGSDLIVGFVRDFETEAKLSRLWTAAAVLVRNYDIDLAESLITKGEYWTNPDDWSDEDLERARIKIDQVREAARNML